jgi:hypothetical protein
MMGRVGSMGVTVQILVEGLREVMDDMRMQVVVPGAMNLCVAPTPAVVVAV